MPPRKECAILWHDNLFELMPNLEFIILVGIYAQKYHLGKARKSSLTETVKNWKEYLSPKTGIKYLPVPHPSWRNNAWIKKNPWFEDEILPRLKLEIQSRIGDR